MFDFTTNTAPTQIIIPSLYDPTSPSFIQDTDKVSIKGWLSHNHSPPHHVHDENTVPSSPTIATVVDSYASSHSFHRRQHSYALSIGKGHPSAMKSPIQHTRPRPPLTIRVPNVAPLNPIRRRIFNTTTSTPISSLKPACPSMPSLQAVSDWVASSRGRQRDAREQRSKVVAAKLLALNNPKPIRIRFPPSEVPRPYVKSSLSQCYSLDC